MSISSNYDYNRYTQYNSQLASAQGHHRAHHGKHSQGTDASQQLAQLLDGPANNTTGSKPANPLDSLVQSGTITTDQEKSIKDAFEASRMAFQTQAGAANASDTVKNPLDSLVQAGTITKDQETAIKSTFDSDRKANGVHMHHSHHHHTEKSSPMTDALDGLVTSGTITSDQKDTILSTLKSASHSRDEQSGTKTNPLDSLVTDGSISKDQEDAIKSAFDSNRKAHSMPQPPPLQSQDTDHITSTLSKLVDDGKITSDQQATILSALQDTFQSSQSNTQLDPTDNTDTTQPITNNQQSAFKTAFDSAIKAYNAQSTSYDNTFWNAFDTNM